MAAVEEDKHAEGNREKDEEQENPSKKPRLMTVTSEPALKTVATFRIGSKSNIVLTVVRGSVVDFAHPNGAIVNAANEGCLGGGGVDGAISNAGGMNLYNDRLDLPIVDRGGVRCPTGLAKLTGPGDYGKLKVPFVVHAVGPQYFAYPNFVRPDKLLRSAYQTSLECCRSTATTNTPTISTAEAAATTKPTADNENAHGGGDDSKKDKEEEQEKPPKVSVDPMDVDEEAQDDAKRPKSLSPDQDKNYPSDEDDVTEFSTSHTVIKHVAFSLLSAGVFKGERSLKGVLRIGVQAIHDWVVKSKDCGALENIVLCAFNLREAATLIQVCEEILGPAIKEESVASEEDEGEGEKESGIKSNEDGGADGKNDTTNDSGNGSIDESPVEGSKDKTVTDNDVDTTKTVDTDTSKPGDESVSGIDKSVEGNTKSKEEAESDGPKVCENEELETGIDASKKEKEETDTNKEVETNVNSSSDENTESVVNASKDVDGDDNNVEEAK